MQLTRTAAFSRVLPVARPARGARVLALIPKATTPDGSPSSASAKQSVMSDIVEGMGGPTPPSQVMDQTKDTKPVPLDVLRESEGGAKPGFEEVMAFAGQAPEVINGRLAMVGFTAAIAAELATGDTVAIQLQKGPLLILLTFIVFIGASLYPFLQGKKVQKVAESGVLTPTAELINGRAAMIGFAALLATEWFKGGALLGPLFH